MKKLKTLFFILVCLVLTITNVNAEELRINSNNAVLYNLNDNKILYEKNKDQKVSIASLTKMMTALVAIENIEDLNKKVTFTKSDYDKLIEMDASGSSLDNSKSYTYEDLLYGLILESGADCANALARLIAGSEENFVKMMNAKAKELGMNNTSFANPIGMDDKNNYASVDDLTILFKAGLKNKEFKKIISTFEYKLSDGTKIKHTIYYYMKNSKISMPYLKGGKTGYEIDAGYALATIAYKNDTLLMLITSKAENPGEHVEDAKKIYDYYFKNYDYQTIINKGDIIKTLNTKYLSEDSINIKADDDVKYYMRNDYDKDKIKVVYDGISTITPENKYKEKIGTLNIYYEKKLIKTLPVTLNQKIYPDFKLIIIACIVYIFIIGTSVIVAFKLRKNKKFK